MLTYVVKVDEIVLLKVLILFPWHFCSSPRERERERIYDGEKETKIDA